MKLEKSLNSKIIIEIVYKVYLPIIILLLLVTVAGYYGNIPISVFTRDIAVTAVESKISPFIDPNYNPFIGVISQIGAIFWCISGSLCIFCSLVKPPGQSIKYSWINFLRFFGFLTFILLFDDLFLLHESVFPELLKIPEKVTYLVYMLLCLWGVVKFKSIILQTEWVILLLSFFWFFCSIVTDSLPFLREFYYIQYLFEDGFKLLGIGSWFYYFLRSCLSYISFSFQKH